MNIAVLGTGMVGKALVPRLAELGHEVTMGTRRPKDADLISWVGSVFPVSSLAGLEEAAAHSEVVINATAGTASLAALEAAGSENLAGKVLIDVANPLEWGSEGVSLSVCNTDSLAEKIQGKFPEARVVKALNTINASLMLDPSPLAESGVLPMCGNNESAKEVVRGLLESGGWTKESILDLGDLTNARGMEAFLLYWVRLFQHLGTPQFNHAIVQ